MKIEILDRAKKKRILEQLERFGIKKIPQLLIRTGIERIRAFSGSLSNEEIMSLWTILPFEGIGEYVAKEISDKHNNTEVRLSVDALHMWREQINQNIFILTKEQEEFWFRGKNLELSDEQKKELENFKGFIVVKSFNGKDFVGTGKVGEGIVYNYLPKERRRKSQTI